MDHEAVTEAETSRDNGEDEELVVLLPHAEVEPDAVVVEAVDADAALVAVLCVGVDSVVAVDAEILADLFLGQVLRLLEGRDDEQAQQDEARGRVQSSVELLLKVSLPSFAEARGRTR